MRLAVLHQIFNRDYRHVVQTRKGNALRRARHGAIIVSQFTQHASRFKACQGHQIDSCFGMTTTGQHAARLRTQREDVARTVQIGGFRPIRNGCTHGGQTVSRRRYLTFLKGRVGRKVADFFMDFLGASEGLNAKAQNKGLLQAVDDFTAEAQLDISERQNVRQQVYSYCNEQLQAGEEIELESLSKELAGVSEVSFQAFTAEKGYELEESFPADRSTLRQLTKFAGSGGGLTINFDAMLLGERIFWDPATDTLTIKGTPPNLRDQLQRRTSGGK